MTYQLICSTVRAVTRKQSHSGSDILYVVWTQSERRPLEPRVWTLMRTGADRSMFSRMHWKQKNFNCGIVGRRNVQSEWRRSTFVHAELITDL